MKEGEDWKDYTETKLKTILSNESQNLGGDNPKNKKEDDIEDINKFEIDIQRIYEVGIFLHWIILLTLVVVFWQNK